jgi:hypothetical protein
MMHSSSGRKNFNAVPKAPKDSQTTPDVADKADAKTIDQQTNEAIKTANAPPKKT